MKLKTALEVWRRIFFLSLRITACKSQREKYFHQWESFMLRWHISLNGCHGNVSPFVEGVCSRDGIFSDASVYYLLQWIIAARAKLGMLSSGEHGR